MNNQQIIQAWKNKKLRNQGVELPANPVGSSNVALKHIQYTELLTSPHWSCSIGPKCI